MTMSLTAAAAAAADRPSGAVKSDAEIVTNDVVA